MKKRAIASLWTSALRQYAAGFYATNKRKASEFPSVPLDQQRALAVSFGFGGARLSCDSCEGRGVLGIVARIHSKGGKVSAPFSSVMVCPECAGAGMDYARYFAARGEKPVTAAVH